MHRLALLFPLALAACTISDHVKCPAPTHHGITVAGFHGGGARLGWSSTEDVLVPAMLDGGGFVLQQAPDKAFDTAIVGQGTFPAHAYASPLYADDVTIDGGSYSGDVFSVVWSATSNGFVYALNAEQLKCSSGDLAPGSVLWKAKLATPSPIPNLDGAMPVGILSTPVLDPKTMRLYVAGLDKPVGAASAAWKAWALDAESGAVLKGWPVTFDGASIERVNQNGPTGFDPDPTRFIQRSALALSPAGDRLYVSFGSTSDQATGWMVELDTAQAKITRSFSAGRTTSLGNPNGGMWGAGGAAVDEDGTVYMTTGNAQPELAQQGAKHLWGDTLLAWNADLTLTGTYAPWNYCQSDLGDADLGGNSPLLLPDLSSTGTTTPKLIAFGSKQGVVYLLSRAGLPGALDGRQACSATTTWQDAQLDTSLLPPAGPPYCNPNDATQCARGPLSVFGPYSDANGANEEDSAKMRSSPAYFDDGAGHRWLFVSGVTRAADQLTPLAPALVRLDVNAANGQPAYLHLSAAESAVVMLNPGAPVVSSNGGDAGVVWVVDENAPRSQKLTDPSSPKPVLYAFDAQTLALLWRSGKDDLKLGGKYVTPVVAHGRVYVATDRLQVFGPKQ